MAAENVRATGQNTRRWLSWPRLTHHGGAGAPRHLSPGLADAGYTDGRNVAVDYVWAEGLYDRLPTLAAELVRRRVDVIVAAGGITAAGLPE